MTLASRLIRDIMTDTPSTPIGSQSVEAASPTTNATSLAWSPFVYDPALKKLISASERPVLRPATHGAQLTPAEHLKQCDQHLRLYSSYNLR